MLRAMARGVALFLVGSLVLVALLGCGRWFEQRDPWRHDAEVECLQSGAVREGSSVARMSPIEGPGICGADARPFDRAHPRDARAFDRKSTRLNSSHQII